MLFTYPTILQSCVRSASAPVRHSLTTWLAAVGVSTAHAAAVLHLRRVQFRSGIETHGIDANTGCSRWTLVKLLSTGRRPPPDSQAIHRGSFTRSRDRITAIEAFIDGC